MGILQVNTELTGQVGIWPKFSFIQTDSTLSEVLAPHFLRSAIDLGYSFNKLQSVLVSTTDYGNQLLNIINGDTLIEPQNSGNSLRFNVRLSSPQTVTVNELQVLSFDNVLINKNDLFDTVNYQFIAPEKCFYHLFSQVLCYSEDTLTLNGVNLVFLKNGENFVAINGSNSFNQTIPGKYLGIITINALVQLEKDDVVSCCLFNSSDVDMTTYLPGPEAPAELNFFAGYSIDL